MPFTPFHFGPNLWIGILLFKFINIGAFLLSNVVIDIEPLIVLLFNISDYPLHGYMHSYLIMTILAIPSAYLYYKSLKIINIFLKPFKLAQESSKKTIYVSFLLGFYFHIFLDSFLYKDITPFYPLTIKPLFGLSTHHIIYKFCSISFLVAICFFIVFCFKKCDEE